MGIEPTSEAWENCCLESQIEIPRRLLWIEKGRLSGGRPSLCLVETLDQLWTKTLLFMPLDQHLAAQGQLNQRGLW